MVDIAGTNLCKNVSFYGTHAHKSQVNKEDNKQQIRANNSKYNFALDTNKQENVSSTYSALVNYLKKEDESKKEVLKKVTGNATNDKTGNENITSLSYNAFSTSTEPKKDAGKRKSPAFDKTFNIIGMFKPGEMLNSLTKEDCFNLQKPSLSFLS